MRRHRHDRQPVEPGRGQRRSDAVAGVAQCREQPSGQTRAVDQGLGPLTGTDVVERRGRRVGPLGADLAGEPERQQIRDQQHRRGGVQRRGRLAQKLVQGVERQVLGARHRVVRGRIDTRVNGGIRPTRARIAIVERRREQATLRVEEAIVDGPRVDAGRCNLACRDGRSQTGEDLTVETVDVPVQPIRPVHRIVGESAYVLDAKLGRANVADNDPSVGRTEIHGSVGPRECRVIHLESPSSS